MKNRKYILSFFIGLLVNTSIFANEENSPKLIYCPDKVECTSSDIGLCHFYSDKQQYFVSMNDSGNKAGVIAGIYNFVAAYARPNNLFVARAECQYTNNGGSGFFLYFKQEANLEAYKNVPSKWDSYSSPSHCMTSDPLQCPLHLRPELVIYREVGIDPAISFLSIKTTANGYPIKNSIQRWNDHPAYVTINYDEAYLACQGMIQCPIQIYYSLTDDYGNNNPYYYNAGSVIVDMIDNMRILDINTGPSNGGNGSYLLKRMEPSNAIQFVR